jgi:hypothetical protein
MPNSDNLANDFYGGTLSGEPISGEQQLSNQFYSSSSNSEYNQYSTTSTFGQTEYDAAIAAGYSDNDINQFLQESGVQAEGEMFAVGGMGTYSGSQDVYWQVSPSYTSTRSSSTVTPTGDNVAVAAPSATVDQTIALPNNGTGTIETVAPLPETVSAPIPILGDPLGESSQRVSIQKAKLSSTAT